MADTRPQNTGKQYIVVNTSHRLSCKDVNSLIQTFKLWKGKGVTIKF